MSGSKERQTMRRSNLWWVWNYDKEEKKLDTLSERGIQLEKPGMFTATFVMDASQRYAYRMDYQPDIKWRQAKREEYLAFYRDAGWEYLGQCTQWHYFRRPWSDSDQMDIYTDAQSLKNHYQRIRWTIGGVLLIEILGLIGEVFNAHYAEKDLSIWPIVWVMAVLDVFLAYGFLQITRKYHRL
ncbi:DUF2812 domain-containing protein [Ferroacidibacillus organovorans]|uniref:DUF2812 domain-containing protein n=1 Tax=Ferroacidibacillus organovorans TaxID=1765683 RepID=A0A101XRU2_9BACL|nr:DUF2812 domain-containing protein [Ferroacidibacillus organovorans]KUO96372.1 hypothetical protein ATW55_04030 [Ferroacidibacillus organovorans]